MCELASERVFVANLVWIFFLGENFWLHSMASRAGALLQRVWILRIIPCITQKDSTEIGKRKTLI